MHFYHIYFPPFLLYLTWSSPTTSAFLCSSSHTSFGNTCLQQSNHSYFCIKPPYYPFNLSVPNCGYCFYHLNGQHWLSFQYHNIYYQLVWTIAMIYLSTITVTFLYSTAHFVTLFWSIWCSCCWTTWCLSVYGEISLASSCLGCWNTCRFYFHPSPSI